jgi:hypothetical protein
MKNEGRETMECEAKRSLPEGDDGRNLRHYEESRSFGTTK